VFLAGVSIAHEDVLDLARRVDPGLAKRLHEAVDRDVQVTALTIPERETILQALDDAPTGLLELRAVLLKEGLARARGDGA
jgi:hypothetical protein